MFLWGSVSSSYGWRERTPATRNSKYLGAPTVCRTSATTSATAASASAVRSKSITTYDANDPSSRPGTGTSAWFAANWHATAGDARSDAHGRTASAGDAGADIDGRDAAAGDARSDADGRDAATGNAWSNADSR